MATKLIFLALFINFFGLIVCRKHHLVLNDELRRDIEITNFGLLQGGMISINITNMSFAAPETQSPKTLIGFTLDMSGSYESASYAEDHTNGNCVLKPGSVGKNDSVATVYLTFNFTTKSLEVNRWGRNLRNLYIVPMVEGRDVCSDEEPPPAPKQPPVPQQPPGDGQSMARRRREVSDVQPGDIDQEQSETGPGPNPDDKDRGQSENGPGPNPGDTDHVPVEEEAVASAPEAGGEKANPDQPEAGSVDGPPESKPGQDNTAPQANGVPESVGDTESNGAAENAGDTNSENQDSLVSPTSAPTHLIRLPTDMVMKNNILYMNTSFVVCIRNKSEQGLYSFFYHHCSAKRTPVNFSVSIVEKNVGPNYLSAGDIPLPTLYATMSLLFLCSAIYWIYYLCHQEVVFKIHYFMFFLALLKSLSLMFHAVDYHYIAHDGRPMQAFEILFYITYLTKGALLFGTIVLIGSGWAFIKPILSDQDKKLFWIVIPLQILANVAYIITDTSEEGEAQYSTWKVMFVTVDIICCGAILYPVIWSIRHLQDAAQTDGKAISLVKLKLFRSYYVLVVCYIYFSRIVVYILKVTMPFQFMWLDEFFFELATYVFYVVTAYKFRPGTDNPYLQLPSDDEDEDEIEMDEVLTETGLSEGLIRHAGNATSRVKQRETNHSA
ncbi:protein GPR107-like isoform X2 [Lytechinus variegatus]|uniref:protein GPR107-like isoform X2 n=1 Tax=Lytechinus variegatus TaxID=7654 RepID=UPI001BB2C3B6|nr:protein GPR107-like isoform X2 [Lytechinus variegatus]